MPEGITASSITCTRLSLDEVILDFTSYVGIIGLPCRSTICTIPKFLS